jgi:hypothetical protein
MPNSRGRGILPSHHSFHSPSPVPVSSLFFACSCTCRRTSICLCERKNVNAFDFLVKEDSTMAYRMQQADVCIICALEEEVNAVEHVIAEHCQVVFITNATDDGRIPYRSTIITNTRQEPLTLVLLCQTRPGPVSAAFDLGTLLQFFQPCFVGMSGICAGDKRHVHLGDLVVAEYAYHFEEGKVTRDESGSLIRHPEGITYGPTSHVLQYMMRPSPCINAPLPYANRLWGRRMRKRSKRRSAMSACCEKRSKRTANTRIARQIVPHLHSFTRILHSRQWPWSLKENPTP